MESEQPLFRGKYIHEYNSADITFLFDLIDVSKEVRKEIECKPTLWIHLRRFYYKFTV